MKRESLSGEGKRFHFEEDGKKREGDRVYSRIAFDTLCILENLPTQFQDEGLLLDGCRFDGPQVGAPITHSNKYPTADDVAKGNRQKILP